jgi:Transposase DDE domain
MEAEFAHEVLSRLPLAEAVLSLWRWVADPLFLFSVFARHRGLGYEKEISFGVLVQLIADALLEHQGSGRKSFERGREQGRLTASVQAVYQKLGRIPLGLSEAWLAESTARLRPVYPEAARLPVSPALRGLEVMIVDGKAIKRVAKRLKPLRGRKGGVLGGKALVALELRSGLVVAMATHPDGETNEAKLVPALLPQVREQVTGRRLWVADRQFCDLTQPAAFATGDDRFLVRYHPKTPFYADATRPACSGQDAQGRTWEQDWGWLGCERAKHRRYVRRLTLHRPGEETIILLTDLLDAAQVSAEELFELYLARWSIEISQPHCHHKGQGFASFVALISPFCRSVFQLGMSRTLFSQAILGSPRSTSGGYSSRGAAGAVAGAVPPLPRPPIESSAGAPALVGAL